LLEFYKYSKEIINFIYSLVIFHKIMIYIHCLGLIT